MKLFIFVCCLVALAASSPVPKDDLQPVNGPAKNLTSKISPSSSPVSSPTFQSGSKPAGANSAFGSPSVHGIASVSNPSHFGSGSTRVPGSGSGSGLGSGSPSGFGRPTTNGPSSRSGRAFGSSSGSVSGRPSSHVSSSGSGSGFGSSHGSKNKRNAESKEW